MSGVFVQNGDAWVALNEAEFKAEADFQRMVRENLVLLTNSGISDAGPVKLLLVKEEAPVPGEQDAGATWWLDLLMVDHEGVPTFVELKRKSDTRLRREVVAQMLDYAAFGTAYWNADTFRKFLDETHEDAETAILGFLGEDADSEAFLDGVQTNLHAGRVRLLLVADHIPAELQRIVEFLNSQMDATEVLAVELRPFEQGDLKTIVPRVFGRSELLSARKSARSGRRQWDEPSFLEEVRNTSGDRAANGGKALFADVRSAGFSVRWGTGAKYGSAIIGSGDIWPIQLYTTGVFYIQFNEILGKKKLRDRGAEQEWVELINNIDGVELSPGYEYRMPSFALDLLDDDANREKLVKSIKFAIGAKKA